MSAGTSVQHEVNATFMSRESLKDSQLHGSMRGDVDCCYGTNAVSILSGPQRVVDKRTVRQSGLESTADQKCRGMLPFGVAHRTHASQEVTDTKIWEAYFKKTARISCFSKLVGLLSRSVECSHRQALPYTAYSAPDRPLAPRQVLSSILPV